MLLLVGNWKMAPEKPAQAAALIKTTHSIAKTFKKTVSVVSCVPMIHVGTAVKYAKVPLQVGAQGVATTTEVAQTGLVSAAMLKAYGAAYCIVGHSESRARGEVNEAVAEQTLRLLEKNIIPIVCIGERERDVEGWYLSVVKDQLEAVLAAIPETALKKLVIAYEPIWAIGKDAKREATPAECLEMVIFIRKVLADHAGEKAAAKVTILYGGSVDELNARAFVTDGGAQGLLVGRVSIEPKRFALLAKAIA